MRALRRTWFKVRKRHGKYVDGALNTYSCKQGQCGMLIVSVTVLSVTAPLKIL